MEGMFEEVTGQMEASTVQCYTAEAAGDVVRSQNDNGNGRSSRRFGPRGHRTAWGVWLQGEIDCIAISVYAQDQ